MKHRTVIFVVTVLYGLDEEWRGIGTSNSFEEIYTGKGGVDLHRAWYKLSQRGFFGEFTSEFEFDSLYGRTNLGKALAEATRDRLIRQDGTYFGRHIDVLEAGEADNIARTAKIPQALVETARRNLNYLLRAQKAAHSPDLA